MAERAANTPPLSTLLPTGSDATQEVPTLSATCYGRFALQRFHAKGGLGEVHVAVDAELGRAVALKRMQDRFVHDAAAKRRFLNEAELTASLEHPGVVPIHGLVHDEQGQPCYAMRFIAGESLADAIKQWHGTASNFTALPFRQLLQRFISVCQTMAYAHSKHIIHRDLKPANVMLGPYGETLVVDWGLAKRVVRGQESEVRDETEPLPTTVDFTRGSTADHVYTQAGQVLGTAGYMSPEQAAGRWDVVGPASDVYSLGATLYELLTGQRPLAGNDLFAVLQKTQAGDLAAPRRVKPAAPQALEAICLRAMALTPEARYASATALAADLEHWLADEPVSAYAEPWTVRSRRWMRRHRTFVIGSVVALAGAVVVLGVSLILVEQNRWEIAQKEEQAVAARDRGSKIIDDVFNDETIDALKRQKDLTPEQKTFLTNMLQYYQEFVREEPRDEQGRARLARAYVRMGRGCVALGRQEEAASAFRRALDLQEKLVADFPGVPAYRRDLANSHNNLGALWADEGHPLKAEAAFRRALDLQEKLVADFPAVPEYRQALAMSQFNLGRLLLSLGQPSAAEAPYRRALDLQEKLVADFPAVREHRRDLANSHTSLGVLLNDLGQRPAAEAAYRRALDLQEKLVTDFPAVPEYRRDLATSHHNLGTLQADLGQWTATDAAFRRVQGICEKLVTDFPAVPEYRQLLARSHISLGALLAHRGQHPLAVTAYRRALELQEKLVVDFPKVPKYRQELARSHNDLGVLLAHLRQQSQVEAAHRRSVEIQEKLVTDFPAVPEYRVDLAGSYVNFGNLLRSQGQAEAGLAWFAKAIALVEPSVRTEPRSATEQLFLRNAYVNRALVLDQLGRHADAITDWDRALALNTGAADAPRIRFLHVQFLARASRHTLSLVRAGQHVKAVALANALAEAKDVPADTLYILAAVSALATDSAKDDTTLREQYAARAVALLRQAVAKGYKDIAHLKKDEDLKALRSREDYQKLLQELEKTKP
jgi:eukaryotic-like serine/threonine-protein kinase